MKLEGMCLDDGKVKCILCGELTDEVASPVLENEEEEEELEREFKVEDVYTDINLCIGCAVGWVMKYVEKTGKVVPEFWDGGFIGKWSVHGFE